MARLSTPVLLRAEDLVVRALLPLLAPETPVAEIHCGLASPDGKTFREVIARHATQLARPGVLLLFDVDRLAVADQAYLAAVVRTRTLDLRGAPLNRRIVGHSESRAAVAPMGWLAEVAVPPWSARPDDVVTLVRRLLARQLGADLTIGDETADALRAHAWPGGIAELIMRVERATIARDHRASKITSDDLGIPAARRRPVTRKLLATEGRSLKSIMDDYEGDVLRATLARHDGNKSRAARELEISRSYLIQKCKQHGIDCERAVTPAWIENWRKRRASGP